MKKRSIIITICAAVMLITACKKDKESIPVSATGYWTGGVSIYDVVLLNRENGTTRLFMAVPNGDTAAATGKVDGTYTLNGNMYRAEFPSGMDTAIIETIIKEDEPGLMKGYYTTKLTPGTRFPAELRK
ncbi:MAG: hypothetical protein WBP16_15185 [Ferruginibacter sp.]